MQQKNKCPILVVSGFLGSGKTTLLGKVLQAKTFAGAAVIINEYGQAGLDHRLIRRVEERTTLLSGGCVCCNRREDLISELLQLLDAHDAGILPLKMVILETTGLADPAPILFSILTHPLLVHHYYIDLVVTCLDSANGELHLSKNPESVKQIVVADKVILTKTDLACSKTVAHLRKRIQALNPAAQITTSMHGQLAEADFLSRNKHFASPGQAADRRTLPGLAGEKQGHATAISSLTIQFQKPLDWTAFGIWMSMLLQKYGEQIFRIKGLVDVGEEGPIVLNGVQHIIHPPQHLASWQAYEKRNSQIVFIMREIQPEAILASLTAFQSLLGAKPEIQELSTNPFAG